MQNRPHLIEVNIYCDETKHFSQKLIQKAKFVYLILKINLGIYLEDVCTFFRHDALYKESPARS